ncbi:MAG: RdgB/HAM1 family non-canonical purine NTP pyrophosphatase [Mariprofundales bacterium]
MKRIIIASNNAKKRREIANVLQTLNIHIVPTEETKFVTVNEDGDTFAANARKKAEEFFIANGLPTLADDSGLMVDCLDGAPGVYSARFAGDDANDASNNAKLLEAMQNMHTTAQRTAHFICSLHLYFGKQREPLVASGITNGHILPHANGIAGFGYDPLFFSPELNKTFAAATAAEKASVSHRGRALRELVKNVISQRE